MTVLLVFKLLFYRFNLFKDNWVWIYESLFDLPYAYPLSAFKLKLMRLIINFFKLPISTSFLRGDFIPE